MSPQPPPTPPPRSHHADDLAVHATGHGLSERSAGVSGGSSRTDSVDPDSRRDARLRGPRQFGTWIFVGSVLWHISLMEPGASYARREVAWTLAGFGLVDSLLLAVPFVLLVALATARCGAQPAATLSRSIGLAAFVGWTLWTAGLRVVDRAWFVAGGTHLDAVFVEHARGDLLAVPWTPGYVVAMALAGVLAAVQIVSFVASTRSAATMRGTGVVTRCRSAVSGAMFVPCVGAALLGLAGVVLPPAERPPVTADHASWPEWTFAATMLADDAGGGGARSKDLATIARTAATLGIPLDPNADHPFIREKAFEVPLPLSRAARASPSAGDSSAIRPNVILLFFESMSAALSSVDSESAYPELTPHLERFAAHGHVFENVFNAATPTLNGMVTTLASHLARGASQAWTERTSRRWNALPRILSAAGYDTVFVHQVHNSYLRTGDVMRQLGFAHVYDREDVEESTGASTATWGCTDDQLFAFARRLIETGALREPFFLVMPTLDTHPPFARTPASIPYRDGTVPLLNSVHTLDRLFGEFWDFVRGSAVGARTAFVTIADHSMVAGWEYRFVRRPEDVSGRSFDEILCVVQSPLHEIAGGRSGSLATQLDIAPTILQLCGLDVRNHFEGRSLFELGAGDRVVVGATGHGAFVGCVAGGETRVHRFRFDDTTQTAVDMPIRRSQLADYLAWKDQIVFEDRLWDTEDDSQLLDFSAGLARLVEDLLHPDPARRIRAARRLGSMGAGAAQPASTRALLRAMEDPDPSVAMAAVDALGQFGPIALPALFERIDDPGSSVALRLGALFAIGAGGEANRPAASRVHALIGDGTSPESRIAASMLLRIDPRSPVTIRELLRQLQAPEPAYRAGILQGIATTNWSDAESGAAAAEAFRPELERLIAAVVAQLDDPAVRSASLLAIESFGPAAASHAGRVAAQLADPKLCGRAARSLAAIGPDAAPAALTPLLEALQFAVLQDQREIARAIGALGTGTAEVRRALSALLQSSDPELRMTAEQALLDVDH